VRFRTTIEASGNNTGILVPDDVVATLGGGGRPKVVVTVGGHTYRSSVARMGGRYLVSLSRENRTAAGVGGGDEVDVDLELDEAPRVVEVPPDLAAALDADPVARAAFDELAYSHQQRHVLPVEAAKAPETRQRRIAGAIATLRAG